MKIQRKRRTRKEITSDDDNEFTSKQQIKSKQHIESNQSIESYFHVEIQKKTNQGKTGLSNCSQK
jgi:hypothetical protein